jgi:two-component system cell cycle response regulator DivK
VAPLVLIVDVDERNARLAGDVLAAAGFATLTAATAADGLALAKARRPDLVLLDLRLPDLDGTEAMARLAADRETTDIPVVASSALRAADVEAWIAAAGFAGYLEKPIDVRTLPELVRGFCA